MWVDNLELPIRLSPPWAHLTLISSKSKKRESLELWLFKFSTLGKFFSSSWDFTKFWVLAWVHYIFSVLRRELLIFSWEKFLCLQFARLTQAGRSHWTHLFFHPVFLGRPRPPLGGGCTFKTISPRDLFSWLRSLEVPDEFPEKRGPSGPKNIRWCHCFSLAKLRWAHFNRGL